MSPEQVFVELTAKSQSGGAFGACHCNRILGLSKKVSKVFPELHTPLASWKRTEVLSKLVEDMNIVAFVVKSVLLKQVSINRLDVPSQ